MRRRTRSRLLWLAAGAAGAVALSSAPTVPAGSGANARPSTSSAHVVQPQPPPGSCHARRHGLFSLPDRRCTPGAIDPAVTQGDIATTICRGGFAAGRRPPEAITEAEKRASLAAYSDIGPLRDYEYDHFLVPLALGGAPNDPRNLWPQPGASPNPKDVLEGRLAELACSGRITLAYAQRLIAKNWVVAYRRYVSPGGAR